MHTNGAQSLVQRASDDVVVGLSGQVPADGGAD